MKEIDLNSFLQKTEELKALFVLGQKVIPFLEEILVFTKDIYPEIEGINRSIEENLKKMPNVSKQLSKVTEATELATTQIMNMIDNILDKSDKIQSNLNNLKENKSLSDNDRNPIIDDSSKLIESITNESNSIMIALQVQDITAQQIAAVNHLLETIQEKLMTIIKKFNSNDLTKLTDDVNDYKDRTNINKLHRPIAFDPDAIDSMTDNKKRQDDVDELINSINDSKQNDDSSEDKSRSDDLSESVSQKDIDSFFN